MSRTTGPARNRPSAAKMTNIPRTWESSTNLTYPHAPLSLSLTLKKKKQSCLCWCLATRARAWCVCNRRNSRQGRRDRCRTYWVRANQTQYISSYSTLRMNFSRGSRSQWTTSPIHTTTWTETLGRRTTSSTAIVSYFFSDNIYWCSPTPFLLIHFAVCLTPFLDFSSLGRQMLVAYQLLLAWFVFIDFCLI